jgi:hypothetical protein
MHKNAGLLNGIILAPFSKMGSKFNQNLKNSLNI